MRTKTYKCAACEGTFETGWPEEEAIGEYIENFGTVPSDDDAIVCDDCYNKIKRKHPEHFNTNRQ